MTSARPAPFPRGKGVPPSFRWDEERLAVARAELDARLYGLTRDEVRCILDRADVYGEEFPGEAFRVLGGYSSLCPELDVASQGETVAEATTMLFDAVTLYLEGRLEDGAPYARPVPAAEDPRPAATVSGAAGFGIDATLKTEE